MASAKKVTKKTVAKKATKKVVKKITTKKIAPKKQPAKKKRPEKEEIRLEEIANNHKECFDQAEPPFCYGAEEAIEPTKKFSFWRWFLGLDD